MSPNKTPQTVFEVKKPPQTVFGVFKGVKTCSNPGFKTGFKTSQKSIPRLFWGKKAGPRGPRETPGETGNKPGKNREKHRGKIIQNSGAQREAAPQLAPLAAAGPGSGSRPGRARAPPPSAGRAAQTVFEVKKDPQTVFEVKKRIPRRSLRLKRTPGVL